MLLHITPKFFSMTAAATLIDLEITELGLHLKGGIDLDTRKPYPNKAYRIACRKKPRGSFDGILIETDRPLKRSGLHVIARWAVSDGGIYTHRVHYKLLDSDFPAASDKLQLWYAYTGTPWQDRRPKWIGGFQRRGEQIERRRQPTAQGRASKDTIVDGRLVERVETFPMPTIEPERITRQTNASIRMPKLADAFRA
jgi:hypothetical protein